MSISTIAKNPRKPKYRMGQNSNKTVRRPHSKVIFYFLFGEFSHNIYVRRESSVIFFALECTGHKIVRNHSHTTQRFRIRNSNNQTFSCVCFATQRPSLLRPEAALKFAFQVSESTVHWPAPHRDEAFGKSRRARFHVISSLKVAALLFRSAGPAGPATLRVSRNHLQRHSFRFRAWPRAGPP